MSWLGMYEPLLEEGLELQSPDIDGQIIPAPPLAELRRAKSTPNECAGFSGRLPALLPPLLQARQRRSKNKSPPAPKEETEQHSQALLSAVEVLASKIDQLGQNLLTIQHPCSASGPSPTQSNALGEGDNSAVLQVGQTISHLEGVFRELRQQNLDDACLKQQLLSEQAANTKLLQELICSAGSLHSPRRSPSLDGVPIRVPHYRPHEDRDGQLYDFPHVEVSVKVYQVCNVDTSQLTFEADFLCRLDWCDPNVEGMTPEDLASLDWSQYYNPHIEVANCKDTQGWLDGMDAVPRRRTSSSEPKLKGPWYGQRLRKTMRFRGTLAMGPVDLRCFPFDKQALPIKLKARRCHGLAVSGTPVAGAGRCKPSDRVRLINSSAMMEEESYWQQDPCLRGRGNYAVSTAGDSLLQFNIVGLVGHHPDETRSDVYEVCMFVKRPIFATYFWDLLILNLLVMLAAAAFWDTAAPELSSRMSISLTVILTLAAYTSQRPSPIEKAPYVTFHDWCEQMSMFLVTGISLQNVIVVVSCGGQHEEAPPYMVEQFERNPEQCGQGWCMSRNMDCFGLAVLLTTWLLLAVYSVFWLARMHRKSANGLRERLASLAAIQTTESGTQMRGHSKHSDVDPGRSVRYSGFTRGRSKTPVEQIQPPLREPSVAAAPEEEGESNDSNSSTDKSLSDAIAAAFKAGQNYPKASSPAHVARPRPKALGRSFSGKICSPPAESPEEADGYDDPKPAVPPSEPGARSLHPAGDAAGGAAPSASSAMQ